MQTKTLWVATSLAALVQLASTIALAHGGGLDSSGCHNDRKRGGSHCHRAGYVPRLVPSVPLPPRQPQPSFEGNTLLEGQTIAPVRPPRELRFKRVITEVQQSLSAFGYFDGPINGNLGPKTREAISHFQQEFQLKVTGTVTPEVLRLMQIEL